MELMKTYGELQMKSEKEELFSMVASKNICTKGTFNYLPKMRMANTLIKRVKTKEDITEL